MRKLLVGSNETKGPLRAVAVALKSIGCIPSSYFDQDVESAAAQLRSADFLLLALSRAGREVSSAEHRREQTLLEQVMAMPSPIACGVLRDVDGYISAPYLTKYGPLMRLVIARGDQRAPLILFNDFKLRLVQDATMEAHAIARAISGCVGATSAAADA